MNPANKHWGAPENSLTTNGAHSPKSTGEDKNTQLEPIRQETGDTHGGEEKPAKDTKDRAISNTPNYTFTAC